MEVFDVDIEEEVFLLSYRPLNTEYGAPLDGRLDPISYMRKKPAPSPPPLVSTLPRKTIALKRDSKSYLYTVTPINADYSVSGSATLPNPKLTKSSRTKSVDHLQLSSLSYGDSSTMPTKGKGFFRTLLRKGKHSKSQTDLTAIPTETVQQEAAPERQLPKELIDTWVSQTTQQRIDVTDPALKGVWPYDKKEEIKSYNGSTTSSKTERTDKTEENNDKPSELSAFNEKPDDTSNFILKEKTKKIGKSGTLQMMHHQFKSTSALETMTLQRPVKKSPFNDEKIMRQNGTHSDMEGSISKNYTPKFQQNGTRHGKAVSQYEASPSTATLMKKRNSTDPDMFSHSQNWETKSVTSGILKNGLGSAKTSPNGTASKASLQNVTQFTSHGRQPSVPSSTYSESSSSRGSGDFRMKELENSMGKTNPHDSGYESGTMKSKKEAPLSLSEAQKKVRRSPTLSSNSRNTPTRSTLSAVDSIPLCFDQLAAMNVSTLQQLCTVFIQSQKVPEIPAKGSAASGATAGVGWFDITLHEEIEPLFTSNKCVIYRGCWKANPQEKFSVMLSFKSPKLEPNFKPHILSSSISFEAQVPSHLIPPAMLAGQKMASNTISSTATSNTAIPTSNKFPTLTTAKTQEKSKLQKAMQDTDNVVMREHTESQDSRVEKMARHQSTPSLGGQLSVATLDIRSPPTSTTNRRKAKFITQYSVDSGLSEKGKDSLLTKASQDSAESLESLQEEAADSILLAVAGEDCDEEADSRNNNHKIRQIYSASVLNSNCNNNVDSTKPKKRGNDGLSDMLMEMAGGARRENSDDEDDDSERNNPRFSDRAGVSLCENKVSAVQLVTCFVTLIPELEKVESLKDYVHRLNSTKKGSVDLEMDIIFVLLQILNIISTLNDRQLILDSISVSDFLVSSDFEDMATVQCHMLNVSPATNQKLGLTCEKLRMFMMQIAHTTDSLSKSTIFTIIDDMIQNASDLGDLRTISTILQYLLWGPKDDEIKIITLAEHRRQAFELWLQLARGKLLNRLAFRQMDKLKIYMITHFLANTNGTELFKITKLLNSY